MNFHIGWTKPGTTTTQQNLITAWSRASVGAGARLDICCETDEDYTCELS